MCAWRCWASESMPAHDHERTHMDSLHGLSRLLTTWLRSGLVFPGWMHMPRVATQIPVAGSPARAGEGHSKGRSRWSRARHEPAFAGAALAERLDRLAVVVNPAELVEAAQRGIDRRPSAGT